MKAKLSHFDYQLPEKLIALRPTEERDESRLMVVHRDTGKIEHKVFKDIIDYFDEGDAMVLNNTQVFPARLYGHKEKSGARIEVFLLREIRSEMRIWDVKVDPARKIRVGNKLYFNDKDGNVALVAEVIDNSISRGRHIRFLFEGTDDEFMDLLHKLGEPPLPKYISTKRKLEASDAKRYQTVYAKNIGAVAAPTAGLHFSRALLKKLMLKGIDLGEVTLHASDGTFQPIEVEDLSKHKMIEESFMIPQSTVDIVNNAMIKGKQICSVGTTSARAMESSISATGTLKASDLSMTGVFIFPPYEFKIPTSIVTNLHLPKSSLLIMVSAFAGSELIKEAYNIAVKEKYRFYSYGDAMLIL